MKSIHFKSSLFVRRTGVFAIGILTFVFAGSAQGNTKSFEFGPGTPNTRSNVRTFAVPSGLEVAAVVKFRRLSGGTGNFLIDIELREPDTAPGVEGPVVATRTVNATTEERTEIIRSGQSNRGCSLPWRVRVKYHEAGAPPTAVFGTARVDFDNRTRSISAGIPGFIGKGRATDITFGPTTGFDQGKLDITANWNHMIGPVPGPNPIKMRIQIGYLLADGSPLLSVSEEAYSSNESNSSLKKFRMIYNVRERTRGQWKLFIRNLENDHDAFMFAPTVNFTPVCP